MNKFDKLAILKRTRENKDKLDMYSRVHVNCIRINSNDLKSLGHFLVKAYHCWRFRKFNIPIVCNAMFKNLDRMVDIFRLDNGDIIEIETGNSYEKKDATKTFKTEECIPKLIKMLNYD